MMQSVLVAGLQSLMSSLERYVRLSAEDKQALNKLGTAPLMRVGARADIIREGDNPTVVRLMVSGWAARYKEMADGRRQLVGLFVPGDFCDLNVYILKAMDHSITTISPTTYLSIPPAMMNELTHERPRISQALLWHELVSAAVMREWLLNIGQRNAFERLAHLFVEMFYRMRAIGQAQGFTCPFPATQNDLADATGLTSVHVNRTLQELRREGLIELARKELRILDFDRLCRIAMFNPDYLHLDHEGQHLDAND